jgi:hypothetical protein
MAGPREFIGWVETPRRDGEFLSVIGAESPSQTGSA